MSGSNCLESRTQTGGGDGTGRGAGCQPGIQMDLFAFDDLSSECRVSALGFLPRAQRGQNTVGVQEEGIKLLSVPGLLGGQQGHHGSSRKLTGEAGWKQL